MRFIIGLFILIPTVLAASGITIQENEAGFCSVDGIIDSDVPGYTGDGYANGARGAGTSALWSVDVNEDDTYRIFWQYANGGGAGDLISEVWINEVPVFIAYDFQHTGSWTNWTSSDTIEVTLESGVNRIRLVSVSENGLANIDYLRILGDGVAPAECIPSYRLQLSLNDDAAGTVSFEPVQAFYDAGTEITLRARTNSGFFFHSWSGGTTGTDTVHTFQIDRNANVEALFYPAGTEAEEGVIGYASVQDDGGTPYLLTGGLYGDTVLAFSFSILKSFLEHPDPFVVTVADRITATGQINIASDKTLLGITDSAHLEGIRIKINDADNIVIRNMVFSKVVQFDEIEINNGHHIWIDGCEFFTDKDNGPEFYDGLLDIKNASSWITVSNTEFHDHFKSILISSGDDSFQDTITRITFYRNYFHDLGSRTPLLRFGRAHIFNNYFKNCTSGINSRMGACIRVEHNYFYRMGNAVRSDMSEEVGFFELTGNIFEKSTYIPPPACALEVPYDYIPLMIDAAEVPMSVAGEDPLTSTGEMSTLPQIDVFPNPAHDVVSISIQSTAAARAAVVLVNTSGQTLRKSVIQIGAGVNQIQYHLDNPVPGLYTLKVYTKDAIAAQKLIFY